MKRTKWGIIGSGKIARRFAGDLKLLSGAELVGLVSRNQESSRNFSEEFGIKSFASIRELLSSDVDVIYIATPHSSHREHSLMAINAGKAVLCEKPFTLNYNESEEVFSLASLKKVFVMEAMWTCFFPAIQECLSLVNAGTIGQVLNIESSFGYQSTFDPASRIYDPALGGGSLLDVGVYTLAFTRMFIDEVPLTIESSAKLSSTGVDESASWNLAFPSGATAKGESSVVNDLPNEARITGTLGEIRIPLFWHPREFYLNGELRKFAYQGLGFQFEAEEVMNSLRNGLIESSRWTHQHSLEVMKLMDLVRSQWSS